MDNGGSSSIHPIITIITNIIIINNIIIIRAVITRNRILTTLSLP